MKLFEKDGAVVTINLDTSILKRIDIIENNKYSKDYKEYLAEKVKSGNQDAILKTISILKSTFLHYGCTDYEQLAKKIEKK